MGLSLEQQLQQCPHQISTNKNFIDPSSQKFVSSLPNKSAETVSVTSITAPAPEVPGVSVPLPPVVLDSSAAVLISSTSSVPVPSNSPVPVSTPHCDSSTETVIPDVCSKDSMVQTEALSSSFHFHVPETKEDLEHLILRLRECRE
jgi:hypothetical protein